jgi:hypothetical protein
MASLDFATAIGLFPLAVALHVADEWLGGFPRWARRFASPAYSDRKYLITHAVAIGGSAAFALLVTTFPAPWLIWLFVASWFAPGVTWNAFFHAGASLRSRELCPGALTGVALYLPLSAALYSELLRERLLSPQALGIALLAAAAFHTLEVRRSVFSRW